MSANRLSCTLNSSRRIIGGALVLALAVALSQFAQAPRTVSA